jgi:hypothetical protein
MNNSTRIHYYHGDASALGGHLKTPLAQTIPVQAPLSLPAVGGYASSRTEKFQVEGILSVKAAYSQVSGDVSEKTQGFTTLVTSVVEGLNVLDIVTADRIVAQISTEHPAIGHNPKVSFLGTRFENLRIGGKDVQPVLDLNLCDQGAAGDHYPDKPCVKDDRFLAKVRGHYGKMSQVENASDWIKANYKWTEDEADGRCSVLCSLVTDLGGDFPGKCGHVLDVRGFGRVLLAELMVDCNSYHLTMLRLELGCPTEGKVSASAVKANGRSFP